ncbi:Restriction endonuclease [Pseudovibrio ascidiaceicola]|uniref:Restriction endonuclease n=1 Tax=Pseudovibrio ascidiaceicola TaxID=285279 RepID=A0A1I4DWL2_9HYPH|nr:restriction endonuclease [Pseudovibrio ascidiaceicola]SFK97974.1 Restriction endonuclease [Pseudovibrio ascidiaceicola]
MSNYTFDTINDKEFEQIVADLLSKKLGVDVETFKSGKDGGVDGRYFDDDDQEVIIQCKHRPKTSLSKLKSILKKDELPKVRELDPAGYIFATSTELSRTDKKQIKEIFSPYIKKVTDVYGREDLNKFIADYPNIEKKHYKLWLHSTNVLQNLFNHGISERSREVLEEIHEKSTLFVETDAYDKCIKHLSKNNNLIVTGSPGAGKTTTAEQICLYLAGQDYELVVAAEHIEELEQAFVSSQKQVFYFDDFLGRNYFEALQQQQDSKIYRFMKRIERGNKKFILTSRTNVLNRGKFSTDIFTELRSEDFEFEIDVDDYTMFEKAQILYNRIWHSELDNSYLEVLYKNKRYLNVIKHKNYNPRIIEYITTKKHVRCEPDEYWQFIKDKLQNPKDIWANLFRTGIDSLSRDLIILIFFFGGIVSEKTVRSLFASLQKVGAYTNAHETFSEQIKFLNGSLLDRTIEHTGRVTYDYVNPSVGDFILSEYISDEVFFRRIIKHIPNAQFIHQTQSLMQNRIIQSDWVLQEVYSRLDKAASFALKEKIEFYNVLKQLTSKRNEELSTLIWSNIYNGYADGAHGYVLKFITDELNFDTRTVDENKLRTKILEWLKVQDFDLLLEEDIAFLNDYCSKFDDSGELGEHIKECIKEYAEDHITEYYLGCEYFVPAFDTVDFDTSDVVSVVSDLFDDTVFSLSNSEVFDIAFSCDEDSVVEKSRSEYDDHYDDDRYERGEAFNGDEAIETLFGDEPPQQ